MMPGFEEEAFERARRMSSRRGSPQREEQKPPPPKPEQPKPEPQKPVPAKPGPAITAPQPAPNLLNTLLGSKEDSLISMLLWLLTDENSYSSRLFALMYLLL